jgi:hypothetical protein
MNLLDEFHYDNNDSYQNNFYRWYRANTVEREVYKEPKLNVDDAEYEFRKQWGYKKLENEIFVN